MNQTYIDYAHYNIWANNRLIKILSAQKAELLTQELVASFPTLDTTLKHIWFGETGWLSRLNGNGWDTTIVDKFSGDSKELFIAWQTTSKDFKNFVTTADLEKLISFEHKGAQFSIPSHEIIQTVFNHGSYHRGQVVMMMRQLGITEIAQTDYIEWVREGVRGNV